MAASQLLGAALRYAALGLRVIPLHHLTAAGHCSCEDHLCPRKRWGKHPRPRRNWPLLATSDQQVIRSWWSRWPDANVGIATGQGKVALDADGEEGQRSLVELQQQYGPLPPTALARTGSGGLHYLFETPVPIQNSSRRCGPGLDTRGERGLIVAAPSLHYSGNRYLWVRHPAEGIATLPDWLLDVLRQAGLVKGAAPDGPPLPRRRATRPADGPQASRRPATSPDASETPPDGQLVERLTEEAIRRFSVTGYGERNDRMCMAVSSLLGRGFSRK